jgi:pSer/pThr/pTyr-binding forkhead associated (FHA) protein
MTGLVLNCDGGNPVTYELVGDVIAIGRDASNDVVIADQTVSAHHASLTKSPSGYRLTDLRSTNGTHYNGVSVTDTELKDGDTISFGSVTAVFRNTAQKLDQTEPLEACTLLEVARTLVYSRIFRRRLFATAGVLALIAIFIIAWAAAAQHQNKRVAMMRKQSYAGSAYPLKSEAK